jgi:Na+/proline symporter
MREHRRMHAHPAKWLTGLGLVLLVLAAALVMYNPHTGAIGFYAKAKTGGFIATGFGLAALACGAFARAGKRPALWIGLLVCLLALAGFFSSAKKFVKRAGGAEPELAYSATIVSLMCAASFFTLINVGLAVRRLPPEKQA